MKIFTNSIFESLIASLRRVTIEKLEWKFLYIIFPCFSATLYSPQYLLSMNSPIYSSEKTFLETKMCGKMMNITSGIKN